MSKASNAAEITTDSDGVIRFQGYILFKQDISKAEWNNKSYNTNMTKRAIGKAMKIYDMLDTESKAAEYLIKTAKDYDQNLVLFFEPEIEDQETAPTVVVPDTEVTKDVTQDGTEETVPNDVVPNDDGKYAALYNLVVEEVKDTLHKNKDSIVARQLEYDLEESEEYDLAKLEEQIKRAEDLALIQEQLQRQIKQIDEEQQEMQTISGSVDGADGDDKVDQKERPFSDAGQGDQKERPFLDAGQGSVSSSNPGQGSVSSLLPSSSLPSSRSWVPIGSNKDNEAFVSPRRSILDSPVRHESGRDHKVYNGRRDGDGNGPGVVGAGGGDGSGGDGGGPGGPGGGGGADVSDVVTEGEPYFGAEVLSNSGGLDNAGVARQLEAMQSEVEAANQASINTAQFRPSFQNGFKQALNLSVFRTPEYEDWEDAQWAKFSYIPNGSGEGSFETENGGNPIHNENVMEHSIRFANNLKKISGYEEPVGQNILYQTVPKFAKGVKEPRVTRDSPLTIKTVPGCSKGLVPQLFFNPVNKPHIHKFVTEKPLKILSRDEVNEIPNYYKAPLENYTQKRKSYISNHIFNSYKKVRY